MTREFRTAGIYLLLSLAPAILYRFPGLIARIESGGLAENFVIYVPVLAMFLLAFLGWKLNQTRIFWAALLMLGAYAVIRQPDAPLLRKLVGFHAVDVTIVALPLGLSFVFMLRECPLFSSRSAAHAFAALGPVLVLAGLLNWAPGAFDDLNSWRIGILGEAVAFPHMAFVSCLIFALVATLLRDAKLKGFLTALTVAFIPVLVAAHASLVPEARAWALSPSTHAGTAFLAASVILLHAMFIMYWQRVYQDELTELPNRRALNDRMLAISSQYSLAMIDIDHFKAFNDEYGHDEGDNVLRLVANHLRLELGNTVYRYGGEEFCAVFDGLDRRTAFDLVDRARAGLSRRTFYIRKAGPRRKHDAGGTPPKKPHPPGTAVRITLSAGVASSDQHAGPADAAIKRADEALYKAKAGGRNQVSI